MLRPLKYGVITLLTFKFSKISIWYYSHWNMPIPPFWLSNFSKSRKISKEYLYTVKTILNSDGALLFQKRLWSWKYLLFWRSIYHIEIKVLRTLLIQKRQKKGDEEKNISFNTSWRDKRDRVFDNSI